MIINTHARCHTDVVNQHPEHVSDIEVTEGDVNRLTAIIQVDKFLFPSTLIARTTIGIKVFLEEESKVGRIRAGGGNIYTVVFVCVASILCGNEERQFSAFIRYYNSRGNYPVVRFKGTNIVDEGSGHNAAVTIISLVRPIRVDVVNPCVTIAVLIKRSPAAHTTFKAIKVRQSLCLIAGINVYRKGGSGRTDTISGSHAHRMVTSSRESVGECVRCRGDSRTVNCPCEGLSQLVHSSKHGRIADFYSSRSLDRNCGSSQLSDVDIVHEQIVGIVAVVIDGNIFGTSGQSDCCLRPFCGNIRVVSQHCKATGVIVSSGVQHFKIVISRPSHIVKAERIAGTSRELKFGSNQVLVVIRSTAVAAEHEGVGAFVGV